MTLSPGLDDGLDDATPASASSREYGIAPPTGTRGASAGRSACGWP